MLLRKLCLAALLGPLCLPAVVSAQAPLPERAAPADARLYVLRDAGKRAPAGGRLFTALMGKYDVFVDDMPVAQLTRFTYVSLEVQPGWHLLWGGSDAEWFDLRAGQTYMVRIREGEGQNGTKGAWLLDPPTGLEKRIADVGLEPVQSSDQSLADLRGKLGGYARIRAKAGDPPASSEIELDRVSYLGAVEGSPGPTTTRGGVLSVTDAELQYASGEVHLDVMQPEVDLFSTGAEGPTWFGVRYQRDGFRRIALFATANDRDHNRAVLAIQNMLAE